MTAPLYRIPGASVHTADKALPLDTAVALSAVDKASSDQPIQTVADVLAQSQVEEVLDELDRELVGLAPVKTRIRDIAALRISVLTMILDSV